MGLRKECVSIRSALQEARLQLLTQLMDAPTKVTANSRVVDVEKAIDNLEAPWPKLRAGYD